MSVLDGSRDRSSGPLVCLKDVPLMLFRDYFPDRLKFSVKMLVLLIYLFILLILSILTYKDMFRS